MGIGYVLRPLLRPLCYLRGTHLLTSTFADDKSYRPIRKYCMTCQFTSWAYATCMVCGKWQWSRHRHGGVMVNPPPLSPPPSPPPMPKTVREYT